jgi:hypothetical protein
MHPEKDPREQRVRERRDKIRSTVENGDYRRMHFDNRELKRRRDGDTFDESMYDEDAGVQSADDDRRKRVRFGSGRRSDRDLFDRRDSGRLRDRSASPNRSADGDGRYGFGSDPDVVETHRRRIRQRSLTPPRRGNAGKELFATKAAPLAPAANIELFPSKTSSSSGALSNHTPSNSKELFPNKTARSNHRRSGAIDASPERFTTNGHNERPRGLAERINGPLADRITRPTSTSGGSLADRITRDPPSLADRITRDEGINIRGNSGMSIRGASNGDSFSIKGASGGSGVKELFPVKTGVAGGVNAGKELFGEKLKGRGLPRRTAASFY